MSNRGFSLIELMIFIVIIGILAAVAIPNIIIPNFINIQERAKEASVKSNCQKVQLAVEDFAVQNYGVYPMNIDTDATPSGDTVVDILPGGAHLENPFTKEASEPVNGTAYMAGQTGYKPVLRNGVAIGYIITGAGKEGDNIITLTSGQ